MKPETEIKIYLSYTSRMVNGKKIFNDSWIAMG